MQERKVIKKGYYQAPGGGWRIWEPGETIYVPSDYKARWLDPSGHEPATKPAKPSRPTTKTDAE